MSIQVLYFNKTDNPTFTPSLNWSALWQVWSEHLTPYFSVPFVTRQFALRLSCIQANTTRRLLPSTDKMSIFIPIHTKIAFSLSMTADFTLHYVKSSKLEQQETRSIRHVVIPRLMLMSSAGSSSPDNAWCILMPPHTVR